MIAILLIPRSSPSSSSFIIIVDDDDTSPTVTSNESWVVRSGYSLLPTARVCVLGEMPGGGNVFDCGG